jgi:hypothetical protein
MSFLDVLPPAGPVRRYRAHGLTIEVDRPAPRLMPAPDDAASLPLRIEFGEVPVGLRDPETSGPEFQAKVGQYLHRHPGHWAVLVEHGNRARFDALGPLGEDHLWYAAVTNAAAGAGYQRGLYPIHGSCVLQGGGAVAFVGPSGSGKTTTVAGLVRHGLELLCDDLCLARPADGEYVVGRAAPELRLIRDSVEALGWDIGEAIGFQPSRDKFAFARIPASCEEAPLAAIVEVAFDSGSPRLERLTGTRPLQVLVGALRLHMRLHLVPASQRAAAFALVSQMARAIPVYRFTRPRNYGAFDAGLAILIEHFGD